MYFVKSIFSLVEAYTNENNTAASETYPEKNEYSTDKSEAFSKYYNNGPNNSSKVISQAQNFKDCFYFKRQEQNAFQYRDEFQPSIRDYCIPYQHNNENQKRAHQITSETEQVEDSSRTCPDLNLVAPPKKIKKAILDCKNDRLFLEAKKHNPPKKIVPFGSMLTIMGSREYIQCMNKGRKICQKNQKIVDFAMANNKQVRSNRGRYLTIAGEQEYEDQKIRNLINTHEHRKNL